MEKLQETGISAVALAQLIGGKLEQCTERPLYDVVIDSRQVTPGCIFFALHGDTCDGHAFLQDAIAAGAGCVITELPFSTMADCAVIRVEHTLYALGALGRSYRKRQALRSICVTGSVGKTTTRQLLGCVFAQTAPTLVTEGNYNSEIGLPLTLLRLQGNERYAVLELGMNHPGEISRLARIALPDVAVITNIGTAHLEYLGSRDGIAAAKFEILDGMQQGGTLIIPADEPLLVSRCAQAEKRGIRVLRVGTDSNCDWRLANIRPQHDAVCFDLYDMQRQTWHRDIYVHEPGEHLCIDAAYACVAGFACGLSPQAIRAGIAAYTPTGLRQKRIDHAGIHIIEDCYNASPESMQAALRLLRQQAGSGRAIACLGDMLELGEESIALHQAVGAQVAACGVDVLITFGPLSLSIAQGARNSGLQQVYSIADLHDPQALARLLTECLHPEDTVLFKASRGVAIERVVQLLLTEQRPVPAMPNKTI